MLRSSLFGTSMTWNLSGTTDATRGHQTARILTRARPTLADDEKLHRLGEGAEAGTA
jgi:hypothetical protein